MKKCNVFVYGTLMQGYCNHHYLSNNENVRYLGKGILNDYEMYHIEDYPGILPKQEEKILGEVYSVDGEVLANLDELEDEGVLYNRVIEKIYLENTKEVIKAYVYVWRLSVEGKEKVKEMPWKPLEA